MPSISPRAVNPIQPFRLRNVLPVPPPPIPSSAPDYLVSDDETSTESSSFDINSVNDEKNILKARNTELEMKLKAMKFLLDMEKTAKKLIIEKFKIIELNYDNEKCAICREVEGEKVVINCKHIFHDECIKKWHKKTCPLCRGNIEIELFKFESKVSKYEHKII